MAVTLVVCTQEEFQVPESVELDFYLTEAALTGR
ncbi:hypothetical protein IPA_08110 [Ignicoccus pacificus DSM 13166]|uniref:Uncharacterized protein n=1 Tax=Ignicoccus pacificus DSM 13166 TaxID=940294 RepID=A0A977PKE6_9CREN|nr:hypothetical protein IPA_08110 [Ignicoccus pacificus DSM 13166]